MFICNKETYRECMELSLLGLPRQHLRVVKQLRERETALFLFNVSDRRLHGVFEASAPGGENINPTAWKNSKSYSRASPFPAQVPFKIIKRYEPLPEAMFRHVFPDGNRIRRMDEKQTHNLIRIFFNRANRIAKNRKAAKEAAKARAAAAKAALKPKKMPAPVPATNVWAQRAKAKEQKAKALTEETKVAEPVGSVMLQNAPKGKGLPPELSAPSVLVRGKMRGIAKVGNGAGTVDSIEKQMQSTLGIGGKFSQGLPLKMNGLESVIKTGSSIPTVDSVPIGGGAGTPKLGGSPFLSGSLWSSSDVWGAPALGSKDRNTWNATSVFTGLGGKPLASGSPKPLDGISFLGGGSVGGSLGRGSLGGNPRVFRGGSLLSNNWKLPAGGNLGEKKGAPGSAPSHNGTSQSGGSSQNWGTQEKRSWTPALNGYNPPIWGVDGNSPLGATSNANWGGSQQPIPLSSPSTKPANHTQYAAPRVQQ